jgi:hypothetical protein
MATNMIKNGQSAQKPACGEPSWVGPVPMTKVAFKQAFASFIRAKMPRR